MSPTGRGPRVGLRLALAALLLGCSSTDGPPVPTSVDVTPGLLSLDQGDTVRVSAVVRDHGGSPIPGASVTYSIDNVSVATVSATGLVTAQAAGTATLTATSGGVNRLVPITVAGPAATLVVTTPGPLLPLGSVRQLTVDVRDAQGRPLNHPAITFVSMDTGVASVSGTGLLTARAVGLDTITVMSGAASATFPIIVATHPSGVTAGIPSVASRPFAVAVSRQGIALAGRQDVPYLQLTTLPDTSFADSILVGSDPTDIAFNSTGTTAYVTNQFSLNLGVINVSGKQSVDSVAITGGNPYRVLVAPNDQHVYVSTSGGTVVEVSTTTKAVTRTFSLSGAVNGLAFEPSGAILYATNTGGVIFQITIATGGVLQVAPGGTLQDIAVSLDGAELYVANETGAIDVRDAASGSRITTIPAAANVFGLKLSPDGARLYGSVPGSGAVTVIDRAARTVVGTITVGGAPRRIAFDRFGTTVLIPNEGGWINVIR